MENVVNFEYIRLNDVYQRLLVEKKNSETRTLTEIRTTVRRKVEEVKNKEDISNVFKEFLLIKFLYPEAYETDKKLLIPTMNNSLGLQDSDKSRRDLAKDIANLEKTLIKEIAPILGITEQTLTTLDTFKDRFVADFRNDMIVDLYDGSFTMKVNNFKNEWAVPTVQLGKKEIGMGEFVIKYGHLRSITARICNPTLPSPLVVNDDPLKTHYFYNEWKGFNQSIIDTPAFTNPEFECRYFLTHLYEKICSKDEKIYNLILDYFAHMVQKPEEKPGWAILLYGKEGCGKDMVYMYLSRMIHKSHFISIGDMEFKDSKHTEWRISKLLVNVTEFSGLTKSTTPHIYQMIEAETARIREMYKDTYSMVDPSRYIITTNREWAIAEARIDTRRFLMPTVNSDMSSNILGDYTVRAIYFKNLVEEMNGNGPAAIYQILKARDISKFAVKTPDLYTDTMENIIEDNESSLDIMVNDIISRGIIPDYNELPNPAFHILLKEKQENLIPAVDIRRNYDALYRKMLRDGANADPKPERLPRQLVTSLGLSWEGKKNNWKHYKMMAATNSLTYILPPLITLREIYYKQFPYRRPPA